MVGLICVGAIGVGAWFTILRTQQAQEQAVAESAPAQQVIVPTTVPTNTPTASPTSTNTPLPTPTATLVVSTEQEVAPAADQSQTTLPTAEPTTSEDQAEVTPTNTLVVNRDAEATPVPGGGDSGADASSQPVEMPQGGGVVSTTNSYLGWAGVGLLFLLILGLISRLRSSSWTLR
ncbi:MAG: hypothetical protein KDF65_05890 [Anaerolineae bacterium]|nr:hypothetical protein [Anaerolineae bacterium]